MNKALAIRMIEEAVNQQVHRHYRIKYEELDLDSLLELRRLLTDLRFETINQVNRAKRQPWRR